MKTPIFKPGQFVCMKGHRIYCKILESQESKILKEDNSIVTIVRYRAEYTNWFIGHRQIKWVGGDNYRKLVHTDRIYLERHNNELYKEIYQNEQKS